MSEILQTEETVKLYEYELYKPDLEDELAHHGILGMHWGKRNGPPYPLSKLISNGKALIKKRKKKAAIRKAKKTKREKKKLQEKQQKLQKTKDEVMKSNDIKTMLNNIKDYSNDDIKKVLDRLDWERKLKDKVSELDRANRSKWQKFKDKVKEGGAEGIDRGTRSVSSKITETLVKKGAEEGLKKLVTDDPDAVINKQFIVEMFKDKKKK